MQWKHTIGPRTDWHSERYEIFLVKTTLTRSLNALFSSVMDEVEVAFGEEIGSDGKGAWFSRAEMPQLMKQRD